MFLQMHKNDRVFFGDEASHHSDHQACAYLAFDLNAQHFGMEVGDVHTVREKQRKKWSQTMTLLVSALPTNLADVLCEIERLERVGYGVRALPPLFHQVMEVQAQLVECMCHVRQERSVTDGE
jgi:hypothetical protein